MQFVHDGHPSYPSSSSVYQQPDADTESIGNAHPLTKMSLHEPPPRLFALIIGINEYESFNIRNLVGAVLDADAMRDYLQVHLGVPSSHIRNLRDSEAKRAAIIDEIKAFSFNGDINIGDPILIYYAGHGGSANTPKGWPGWEVGSDRKIELLIPYDHSSPLKDGNHKHGIPDRTLGALLSHIASEKGDNITVILDCCHSGSGTRKFPDPSLDPSLDFKARAIDLENVKVPSNLDQDIWSVFESSKDVELERGSMVHSGFAREGLRSHVLLAACHSDGAAYERKSRGVFTVALLETLMKPEIEIDKLTYATLFDVRMPPLSSGQHPQCEGFNQNRIIFNGKAPGKRAIYYKIRESEGETYVMPDSGEAAGITVNAEFEVYQDLYSGHLLGTVIARELSDFSTTLYAMKSRFALKRDGVAFMTCSGAEERVRIHVADESLKDLVKKIDPKWKIIRLVERDRRPEFGIALEDGEVVFNIYDPVVTKYGLTRMPYTVQPTLEALTPVIRGAAHFYWHRRRTPQDGRGLASHVDIKATELKQESVTYDDGLNRLVVYGPTGDWKGGKEFNLQTGLPYGWRIDNKCDVTVSLYPALFYFDNSDWSITSYYQPPTAQGIVDAPLKGKGYLTVGYGDSGSVPRAFFLRDGQNVDVGILKLFLSRKQVNLSHVSQLSPFISRRGTAEFTPPTDFHLPWDTVEIPVVQRHRT